MNLVIDQGNTRTKAGVFLGYKLIEEFVFEDLTIGDLTGLKRRYRWENSIFSSVASPSEAWIERLKSMSRVFIEFSNQTPVPIENKYKTPETLGLDRLAVSVAANALHPDTNLLIIDAGTAITYDFVNAQNEYLGGNISPGMDMRFKALHRFTHRLPLVESRDPGSLLGDDTYSAILSGVVKGIVFEMDGYITELKKEYPDLLTFLTGGNAFFFDRKLKNSIFASENLLLIGLNRILLHNV